MGTALDGEAEAGQARCPEHARRVRVAGVMLGTLFFADLAVFVTRLWTDKPAPLVLPFFLILLGLSWALHRGAIRWAAHGTSALVVLTVLGMTYLAGGLIPILHVLAVIPLFATFVLGRRAGLFWFVICAVALGAAKIGVTLVDVPPPSGRELPGLSVLITLGLAFAVVHAFETQRASSTRALRQRDADSRALLSLLPDIVLRVGPDGLLQNSAPERLSNEQARALLGLPDVGACLRNREQLNDEDEVTVELDGRPLTVRLVPVEGRSDLLVLVRDRSQTRRLEQRVSKAELVARLERADRMSSLGVMAACIAHEVNNPLAYLSGNLAFLQQRAEREAVIDAEHREAVRDAMNATERVQSIVGQLKHYARQDTEAVGPVSVSRLVEEAVKLVGNELRHSATVEVDVPEERWVTGVESRLVQVVLNLLLNASQAFEDKKDENRVWVRVEDEPERVVLRVQDNGPGIPEDLLHRVSAPFFTTKAARQGTGLGLAVCEEIVVQSRGEMRIGNRAEGGAEVSIHLPRSEPPRLAAATTPIPRVVHRRARILVIDDEPLVRRALVRLLREHEIVEAASGLEGLAYMEEGEPIDAILCDVMMPQLSGLDVVERMRLEHPELTDRLVLMSGGAFDPRIQELLKTFAELPLIDKPFDVAQLRSVLGSRLSPPS